MMADYIKREDALEALKIARGYCPCAYEDIKNLPAADVAEARHGRWIWDTSGIYPKPLCSKCCEEPWRRSNHQSDLPNYCPNCGAKMAEVTPDEQ